MRTVKFTKRHGHKWDETGTVWLEFPVDELRRRCVDGYLDRLAGTECSEYLIPSESLGDEAKRLADDDDATQENFDRFSDKVGEYADSRPRTCWSRGSCC